MSTLRWLLGFLLFTGVGAPRVVRAHATQSPSVSRRVADAAVAAAPVSTAPSKARQPRHMGGSALFEPVLSIEPVAVEIRSTVRRDDFAPDFPVTRAYQSRAPPSIERPILAS